MTAYDLRESGASCCVSENFVHLNLVDINRVCKCDIDIDIECMWSGKEDRIPIKALDSAVPKNTHLNSQASSFYSTSIIQYGSTLSHPTFPFSFLSLTTSNFQLPTSNYFLFYIHTLFTTLMFLKKNIQIQLNCPKLLHIKLILYYNCLWKLYLWREKETIW